MSSSSHHPVEGSRAWFFHEFWPLMIFAGCFMLMMAIPLVMTGFLTIQALLIIKTLLVSLLLALTVPRVLPLYLLAMAVAAFCVQPGAFQAVTAIAVTFTFFVIVGMCLLPVRKPKQPLQ
jgi:hypothetical protein